MIKAKYFWLLLLGVPLVMNARAQTVYHEPYRPQVHFSPKAHWTNDPNGLVYYKGIYHLFFQYYPEATVWGPMHWGHATSKDLIHWQEKPIALYPDSLGYIFSGSAVVDYHNTTGFGTKKNPPLVAMFTHHDPKGEKEGRNDFQNQSLAYSLDNGETWKKYSGNPVLKNPGIKDFRDPKVMWYEPQKKWVLTLATLDHITFYSSPDMKNWTKESEFGKQLGAHGGVWECPDLFPLKLEGKTHWVLIVNLNPGGPNGGSATQYFMGQFNGKAFVPDDQQTRWMDYGPDEYAGVTWSNTGNRRIFIGWMSNWLYANQVPTERWRNAMTIPRELLLKRVNGEVLLASTPVKELEGIEGATKTIGFAASVPKQFLLDVDFKQFGSFSLQLSNSTGEKVVLGYDAKSARYYLDRSASGVTSFNKDFLRTSYAPALVKKGGNHLQILVDVSSLEAFVDGNVTVISGIFFPKQPYNRLRMVPVKNTVINKMTIKPLFSIWK
ncbi:glycoside hydrolase family 32 protein [Mucilaginibacter sp. RS28]|uniref:Glycoside hydrolase family 32 protein n=1 Tax=Mucilaginibacter straminoryzae TaxID=2932774 RepID=A0A9X2B8H9_9SPHI|nr:glycoside hydrolase family 32 protein [Mucilaginibacter straminoryzae]MCJ8208725.1 glycoside hydrolase family 32 protein [Mucilaginibacter straminoryzae]